MKLSFGSLVGAFLLVTGTLAQAQMSDTCKANANSTDFTISVSQADATATPVITLVVGGSKFSLAKAAFFTEAVSTTDPSDLSVTFGAGGQGIKQSDVTRISSYTGTVADGYYKDVPFGITYIYGKNNQLLRKMADIYITTAICQ